MGLCVSDRWNKWIKGGLGQFKAQRSSLIHPSFCPHGIFQRASPRQPGQDSDPPGRRSLNSGQRSIKSNLFLLREAMVLPSSCSHPPCVLLLNMLRVHIHPLWRIPKKCILLQWLFFHNICASHAQKAILKTLCSTKKKGSVLVPFALNPFWGINASLPFLWQQHSKDNLTSIERLLTWICLKLRRCPEAISHKRNLRQYQLYGC